MPRKSQFRRTRRLRLAARAGVIAIALGGTVLLSAVHDVALRRSGGWPGVVVALVLVSAGIGVGLWVIRARGRSAASDAEELRAAGADDGLPMGAFRQGQRVGLEAADLWFVWGALTLGVGLLFAVAGATDAQVGWRFGLAFSSVGFVPAAMCFWVGTGTKYWLTRDGIETSRWPRRFMRWADVVRVVPLRHGSPAVHFERPDAIELQTAKPVQGAARWWRSTDFRSRWCWSRSAQASS